MATIKFMMVSAFGTLKLWLLLLERAPKGLPGDYFANRTVHSAAISSCLALSAKYK